MARKRRVDHELVVKYAQEHPEMLQAEIAVHFSLSPNHVSLILRTAGEGRGHIGRPPKPKPYHTDDETYWEQVLHDAGLGMDRGLRIDAQRILYGHEFYADETAF